MPFKESSPAPSDPRPESYEQYKQERGLDLIRATDFAHYFNSEMHVAGGWLRALKYAIEDSAALSTTEKEQLLQQLAKIQSKLTSSHTIANDAFEALEQSRK